MKRVYERSWGKKKVLSRVGFEKKKTLNVQMERDWDGEGIRREHTGKKKEHVRSSEAMEVPEGLGITRLYAMEG